MSNFARVETDVLVIFQLSDKMIAELVTLSIIYGKYLLLTTFYI